MGHKTQCFPNIAPYPFDATASVYNSKVDKVSHSSDRKKKFC